MCHLCVRFSLFLPYRWEAIRAGAATLDPGASCMWRMSACLARPACLPLDNYERKLHFHHESSSLGDSLLQQLSLYPACFITGLLRTDPRSLPAGSQMLPTWDHDLVAPPQSSLLRALYQSDFQFLARRCCSKFLPLDSLDCVCFITLP